MGSFSVVCSRCAQRVPVSTSQAGSTIACTCAAAIDVPNLSQLRRLAGQGGYEASLIDTINRMQQQGQLPWGTTCAVSGVDTTDTVHLYVECERRWIKHREGGVGMFTLLAILFLPFWWIWLLLARTRAGEPAEEHGRDTIVRVPLRVCAQYQRQLAHMSQPQLRELLCRVPVYADLLEEYPEAQISPQSGAR